MELQAAKRLTARLPTAKDMLPTEDEVKAMPEYKQLIKLAENLVDLRHKMKVQLARLDLNERPIMKDLVSLETGLDFDTIK